jgi:DNA invertase Pin-like site-specific DNA recombinase
MSKALTAALDVIDAYQRPRLRAVLYLRVSTEEQVEGYGLTFGEKRGLKYIESKGWDLVDTYKDPGVSGSLRAADRPDLKRLMEAAGDKGFDVVVVPESRVIGRTDRAFWSWVWELEDQGIFVADAKTGMDNTTEEGKEAMREEANYAFKEYTRIRNRTQNGVQEKALEGGYAGGKPKFGFRVENLGKKGLSRLVPDECDGKEACAYENGACATRHEADTLRIAHGLIVGNEGEWHAAALDLNGQGRTTRTGKPWTGGDLRIVLMREDLHKAQVRFREVRRTKDTGREGVTIKLDPIFSEEEIEELKAAVRPRRRHTKRREGFILSGRIDSLCGSYYVGRSKHYMCRKRTHKNTCACPAVPADLLDTWAWGEVRGLLGDAERLKALAEEWVGLSAGNRANYLERLAELDRQIEELQETIDLTMTTAARAAARRKLGREEAEKAVERAVRPLEKELLALEKTRAEVTAWQAEADTAGRRAADLQAMAASARHQLDAFTPRQKADLLGLLNLRIAVKGQRSVPSTRSRVVLPPMEMTGDVRPGVLGAIHDTGSSYSWVNSTPVIVRFSMAVAA